MQPVKLISIPTAVPPHAIEQRDAAAAAHHCFGTRYSDFKRLARVFENSGIRRRYAVHRSNGTSNRWAGRSETPPISKAPASCLSTRRPRPSATLVLRPLRSIRWSRSRRPASLRPVLKRASPAESAFAPMRRVCRCSAWAAPVASRGSRLRPLGAIPARHLRVAGRGRTLHAGFPARRTDQGHANGTRVKPYAWRMHQAQLFQNIWNIPTSWLAKLTPRRDRYQAVP
jgi:hypothetical protein